MRFSYSFVKSYGKLLYFAAILGVVGVFLLAFLFPQF